MEGSVQTLAAQRSQKYPTRRKHIYVPLVLLFTVLGVMACSEDEVEPAVCMSDSEFFQKKVSLPILEKKCMACHTSNGSASHTKNVLRTPAESNYLKVNYDVLRDVAAYERDGESILLSKVTGGLRHGGGLQIARDSDQFAALQELVNRFRNPVSCTGLGDAKILNKVQMASLPSTIRRAKIQLIGQLPASDEVSAVTLPSVSKSEAAAKEVVTAFLEDPAFEKTLFLWFNELLLTDKYNQYDRAIGLLDRDDYPQSRYYEDIVDDELRNQTRAYANEAVAREPLHLISHIVRNNRPITEILTADYMLVNPYSAKVYGATGVSFKNPNDPMEFREAKLNGVKHAGLLTSPMFLNRFPTTDTNVNRHRARMVWKLFLATDILKSGSRPIDPTKVADINPTLNNPNCSVCHALLDPIAGAFMNYDDRGRFRIPEGGWHPEMRPPGFGNDTLPTDQYLESLAWLGEQVTNDSRFALAMVHIVYHGLTGRDPVDNPTDDTDPRFEAKLAFHNIERKFLEDTAEALQKNGYNLKSIIADIIMSPFYRADGVKKDQKLSDAEADALAPLGTFVLLWPERLNDKIVAVTGYHWMDQYSGNDYLINPNQYLFFYGGIDSDLITQRIDAPNGLMANIGLRMSAQMGCQIPAHEFSKPMDKRQLLSMVEPTFAPADANGFEIGQSADAIKHNIQYLHQRILDEDLALDDPELLRTYQLFYDTWAEGNAKIERDRDKPWNEREATEYLSWYCEHRMDLETREDLPDEQRVNQDPNYVMRAWSAVFTYLLGDARFLHP